MNGDPPKENTHVREPSLDWTLSLPFSTDVPGGKIFPSSATKDGAATGEHESGNAGLEEEEKEDWTLCMPLKVRVEPPIELPPIPDKGESGSEPEAKEGDEHMPDPSVQDDSQPELGHEHEPESVHVPDYSHDHDWSAGSGAEDCQPNEHMKHLDMRDQLPTPGPSPTPSSPLPIPSPFVRVHVDSHSPETEHELGVRTICDSDGGLDIDSGRGKRGSGWNVFGWFGDDVPGADVGCQCHQTKDVSVSRDWACVTSPATRGRRRRSSCNMRAQYAQRYPRHDSTCTLATTETAETVYYSARSSWLVG
ncbi:hypothetical protein SCLCIDRAFT_684728 [Scleroderma citrinum Foug A]|uniref:Uncharacterized protein n=1 Tax=Scleroderma citrinum Foug A TaxID=1036808 RepID=A0A0C3D4U5_9AGAM|nr:hypothetical protein SCLCIDRAFT_684728 [Scleroderma citrinum Foug A]